MRFLQGRDVVVGTDDLIRNAFVRANAKRAADT